MHAPLPDVHTEHRQPNVKLNYAKRMAQGYLKSEGLGVYTPKTTGYVKESKSDESQSQWKKVDNENDFESKTSERKINSENGRSTDEEMKGECFLHSDFHACILSLSLTHTHTRTK